MHFAVRKNSITYDLMAEGGTPPGASESHRDSRDKQNFRGVCSEILPEFKDFRDCVSTFVKSGEKEVDLLFMSPVDYFKSSLMLKHGVSLIHGKLIRGSLVSSVIYVDVILNKNQVDVSDMGMVRYCLDYSKDFGWVFEELVKGTRTIIFHRVGGYVRSKMTQMALDVTTTEESVNGGTWVPGTVAQSGEPSCNTGFVRWSSGLSMTKIKQELMTFYPIMEMLISGKISRSILKELRKMAVDGFVRLPTPTEIEAAFATRNEMERVMHVFGKKRMRRKESEKIEVAEDEEE
ncbi:hypothetical protein ADUPG1_010122, partial [Aduncisulcus paluster]